MAIIRIIYTGPRLGQGGLSIAQLRVYRQKASGINHWWTDTVELLHGAGQSVAITHFLTLIDYIRLNRISLAGLVVMAPDRMGEYSHAECRAIAEYNEDYTREVTRHGLWWIEPNICASIDENGLLSLGRVESCADITIFAEYSAGGIAVRGNKTIQVIPAVELEVTGPELLPINFEAQYEARVCYENNRTRDVTETALWWLEPNSFASIEDGLLRTGEVNEAQELVVYCQYTGRKDVTARLQELLLDLCNHFG